MFIMKLFYPSGCFLLPRLSVVSPGGHNHIRLRKVWICRQRGPCRQLWSVRTKVLRVHNWNRQFPLLLLDLQFQQRVSAGTEWRHLQTACLHGGVQHGRRGSAVRVPQVLERHAYLHSTLTWDEQGVWLRVVFGNIYPCVVRVVGSFMEIYSLLVLVILFCSFT